MNLPFSQACENNKDAILEVLLTEFSNSKHVLEIGSGTGQHACYFSKEMPFLTWQCSDLLVNHDVLNSRIDLARQKNLFRPISLDLQKPWQLEHLKAEQKHIDAIFTANTLHIMRWQLVINFFAGAAMHLPVNGILAIYGPFNYQGQFTSESNAEFNAWLKARDNDSGIRDFEAIEQLAKNSKLTLINDYAMPANNRLLVFKKVR